MITAEPSTSSIGSILKRLLRELRAGKVWSNRDERLPHPFDSWAEFSFYRKSEWCLNLDTEIHPQARFTQDEAEEYDPFNCRLDFLLITPGNRRINVEIDGAVWHDAAKDSVRDSRLLDIGYAHVVYRFDSDLAWNDPNACLAVLAMHEPECFTPGAARWLTGQYTRVIPYTHYTRRER